MSQRGRNDTRGPKTRSFGGPVPVLQASSPSKPRAASFKRTAASQSQTENDARALIGNIPTFVGTGTRQGAKCVGTSVLCYDGLAAGFGGGMKGAVRGVAGQRFPAKSPKHNLLVSPPMSMEVERMSATKVGGDSRESRDNLTRASAVYTSKFDCAYEKEINDFLHKQQAASPQINWSNLSITPRMRLVLIDWLIEVAEEYRLQDQTLFLAVFYLERCIAKPVQVNRNTLQLLGITCLFIAAKLEEVYPPPLKEFAYITDHTYTPQQILQQENIILETLQFSLTHITVQDFLQITLAQYNVTVPEHRYFALYLSQLILPSQELFLNYLPSELATAIAMLTSYTFNTSWPLREQVINFLPPSPHNSTADKLRTCIIDTFKFCSAPPKALFAAKNKYEKPVYGQVSNVSLPSSLPL